MSIIVDYGYIGAVPGVLQSLVTGVTYVGVFLHQVDYEVFSCNEKEKLKKRSVLQNHLLHKTDAIYLLMKAHATSI